MGSMGGGLLWSRVVPGPPRHGLKVAQGVFVEGEIIEGEVVRDP